MLKEKERKRAKEEGVMRITYPKVIGESEEDSREPRTTLTRTANSGSGAYAAEARKAEP